MFDPKLVLLMLMATLPPEQSKQAPLPESRVVQQVSDSGRCATLAETPDERVAPPKPIPAGAPPLLSFRLYESKAHNRSGNAGLMLDDAGH